MARTPDPVPADVTVEGEAGTVTVNPRASVLSPRRPWSTNERGWLNFDNWGFGNYGYGFVSDDEKAEMLCDGAIAALLYLRRSWVLSEGIQVLPCEGIPPVIDGEVNPEYEKAIEIADFCRATLEGLQDETVHEVAMRLQEADWYHNMAGELVWRDQETGPYAGKMMLDAIPVYDQSAYTIWEDKGRIIGLQSTQDGVYQNGKPKVYPLEKFALYRFRPAKGNRYGITLASVTQLPHYKKRIVEPQQLENMAQFASPYVYGIASDKLIQDVPLPTGLMDAYGRPLYAKDDDGNVIKVPPQMAMANGISNFQAGGWGVFAGGSNIGLLEAQGDGSQFLKFFDHIGWDLAVAILGTGTLTQEQRYGSNATAQTGETTAQKPVGGDRPAVGGVFSRICKTATRYNFKSRWWHLAPTVRCGDPNRTLWESLLLTFMNAMPVEQGFEVFNELCQRCGLTSADANRIRQAVLDGKIPLGTVNGSQMPNVNKATGANDGASE